ncbi:MAG: MFS transporter, partial [Sedimentisphaerales bacterium]|nr:MFS transporter [Sedimentisphaerales bacterium]
MNDTNSTGKSFRNVYYLGLVSLFTDLSSQMIYPLVPEFLSSMGVSKAFIGLIEGVAESTASLLRTVFGRWSDKVKNRKLFIYMGYGLSAMSRPFLYLAHSWVVVLGVRFSDRVGKAARTPARDALISTSVPEDKKGKAFGFHRAMDRTGAIGGPLLALLVLYLFRDSENKVRLVFLLSFIPAILALGFIHLAREVTIVTGSAGPAKKKSIRSPAFILFLVSSIVFTLGNSSNAFLILKAREAGLSVAMIPGIWVLYNIFCTISSPIFGTLSDRVGRAPVIATSFIYYSIVYFCFGLSQSLWAVWVLFGLYGIYYGLSEGVFRAYISDLVEPDTRATAYGLFNTGMGLALIPASIIFGVVWESYGSQWAFMLSAGFSLLGFAIFLLSLTIKHPGKE